MGLHTLTHGQQKALKARVREELAKAAMVRVWRLQHCFPWAEGVVSQAHEPDACDICGPLLAKDNWQAGNPQPSSPAAGAGGLLIPAQVSRGSL